MSYVRFGSEGSDVYVYCDVRGYLCCCACWLAPQPDDSPFHESQDFASTDAMVAHLREHIAAGHTVPERVIPDLEADRAENDAFIAEQAA